GRLRRRLSIAGPCRWSWCRLRYALVRRYIGFEKKLGARAEPHQILAVGAPVPEQPALGIDRCDLDHFEPPAGGRRPDRAAQYALAPRRPRQHPDQREHEDQGDEEPEIGGEVHGGLSSGGRNGVAGRSFRPWSSARLAGCGAFAVGGQRPVARRYAPEAFG